MKVIYYTEKKFGNRKYNHGKIIYQKEMKAFFSWCKDYILYYVDNGARQLDVITKDQIVQELKDERI